VKTDYRLILLLLIMTFGSSFLYARQNRQGLHVGGKIHNGWLKADEYSNFSDEGKQAYAMGLLDGMYMAPAFGAPDDNKILMSIASCVEGMKSTQVAAIIEKYVHDHPEKWHWDLKLVGYNALLDACPRY
jgi:hypothetical protein